MRCLKCGAKVVASYVAEYWDCAECGTRWFPERGAAVVFEGAAYVDRSSGSGEYAWTEVPRGTLAVLSGEVEDGVAGLSVLQEEAEGEGFGRLLS